MPESAVATTSASASPLKTLQDLLEKYRHQIAVALPRHVTPERMIRVALTAVSQSEKLQKCDPFTICGCVVQASLMGLEPSSVLGECFLVPFWNKRANRGKGGYEAQLVVGYQGKIKLVSNTGELLGVRAAVVRQHDEFEFDDGIDPFVRHRYFHLKDRGPVVGYWAGARLKNGFTSVVYMTVAEIEEHRDRFAMTRSKEGGVFGLWMEHPESMALKTVIHKCLKYVPKSAVLRTAWALDEAVEAGIPQKFSVDIPIELQPAGADDADGSAAEMPQRKSEQPQAAKPAAKEVVREYDGWEDPKLPDPMTVEVGHKIYVKLPEGSLLFACNAERNGWVRVEADRA